ncbi:MAG: iron-sulfur cluster carrier protein ApbC [Gammaproteobacteria bacterium]|nr:iron-sulfur cluster carrier protein ApbC [Gammaproteobacteria bacterium]NNL99330.1 iron-sulfur cluster carrier protein ApbC [Gammaproteobacteria bacterium]
MSVTRDAIESQLKTDIDPYLATDLVSAGAIKDIVTEGASVRVTVELGFPVARYAAPLTERLTALLGGLDGVRDVTIDVGSAIVARAVQKGVKPLAQVRNTIAVASGKGGVGKSTTAVNLALALQQEGARVGVLDADIYGPSVPRMLGCPGKPDSPDGKSIEPKISYEIQSISIGNLVDEETPMIWRGPMVTSALQQLLGDTNWQDIDYLVIDLPPGTGDIQLTLCQQIPVTGALIVTTPQDIALLDARKALRMFEKVEVPVLGIVENMSTHICSNCGHEEHIFGAGGGSQMARQYGVELLGSLPLDIRIREGVDTGKPTVAFDADGSVAAAYREIARRAAAQIMMKNRDFSASFPRIVVENA